MSLLFEIQIDLDISHGLEATALNKHTQKPVKENALYYEDAFLSLYSKKDFSKSYHCKAQFQLARISKTLLRSLLNFMRLGGRYMKTCKILYQIKSPN